MLLRCTPGARLDTVLEPCDEPTRICRRALQTSPAAPTRVRSCLGQCQQLRRAQLLPVSLFGAVTSLGCCVQAKGVPLASNQVQYSLLYREPERNGVKKAIEDVGATLVAYSPLNQGLLTGQPQDSVRAEQKLPKLDQIGAHPQERPLRTGTHAGCIACLSWGYVMQQSKCRKALRVQDEEEGVSVAAGFGACAGKYTENNLPKGPRGAVINADRVREVQPLLSLMRDIGSAHGSKTPGQVISQFLV